MREKRNIFWQEENMFEENKYRSGQYIVGSIDKASQRMSISTTPVVHGNRAAALAEAERLAKVDTSKKFVALKFDGIVHVAGVVVE